MDKELIEEYTKEYNRTTGSTLHIYYAKGWYYVSRKLSTLTPAKMRKAAIVKAIEILKARPRYLERSSEARTIFSILNEEVGKGNLYDRIAAKLKYAGIDSKMYHEIVCGDNFEIITPDEIACNVYNSLRDIESGTLVNRDGSIFWRDR